MNSQHQPANASICREQISASSNVGRRRRSCRRPAFLSPRSFPARRRWAFTLTELLFVILILAILGGLAASGLAAAFHQARIERTRAIVARLDQLIMEKYNSYRTRPVPIKIAAGTNPRLAAQFRLYALRELMRVEMPDRIADLCTAAELSDLYDPADTADELDAVQSLDVSRVYLSTPPALAKHYKRIARNAVQSSAWTTANEGAECLFLIVSVMRDGEDSALDFFGTDEIGDTDGDGMLEFLDAWGQPIHFFRWAPGYLVDNPGLDNVPGTPDDTSVVTPQTRDFNKAPDPFDPQRVDPRWNDTDTAFAPFALKPLILSAGPDKFVDLERGRDSSGNNRVIYATTIPPNDPYLASTPPVGTPNANNDGAIEYPDNITNHDLGDGP